MTVGSPGLFAIESRIVQAYERLSLRALGCFLIYVNGNKYGVDADDATMLANSFDEVVNRINHRGRHRAHFCYAESIEIAHAVSTALYTDSGDDAFFSLSEADFGKLLRTSRVIWAPDGDEAFDDGSHVLQFDTDDRVRIVGFKRLEGKVCLESVSDVWLSDEQFYGTLSMWRDKFENDWASRPKIHPSS